MRIGVISDTHGFLDPKVGDLFAGVEHILHAGDIGGSDVIDALAMIAPVSAVGGNNDFGPEWAEHVVVELGGRRILIRHIVEPAAPDAALARLIARSRAEIVVFGHTHRPLAESRAGCFFLNPGYAGRPRFKLARTLAILRIEADLVRHEFVPL